MQKSWLMPAFFIAKFHRQLTHWLHISRSDNTTDKLIKFISVKILELPCKKRGFSL